MAKDALVAVVIPSYKVKKHILDVISHIGQEVSIIYVVDDACPEKTGAYVKSACQDTRVRVLFHEENKGVGGAVITGYRKAVEDGVDIVIKIDGDGQMDTSYIPAFINPLVNYEADYVKGNRFYHPEDVRNMPPVRLLGNACLSFITKLSSGYWNVFDPTNGFTAISTQVIEQLPLDKIAERYFFESDMLFRLNTLNAVVTDVPMKAIYGEEVSNLHVGKILFPFLGGNIRNTLKRITYNYFLRNVSIATFELVLGVLLLVFGVSFGSVAWVKGAMAGTPASSGTVMMAALPIITGMQMLLAFLSADIASVPRLPLIKRLKSFRKN